MRNALKGRSKFYRVKRLYLGLMTVIEIDFTMHNKTD
uniref:Uncharacterized protein n=1 Tax=Rhizophora mucronata TaxID=61149 RepID=A0A2P2NW13_RHIMU